jgi:SSS family solute:Na+ symporter
MTLGQLVEMRYGRRNRILFGILVYMAGVLNMGIFPAIGAGFFVYCCCLPPTFTVGGMQAPTILPIMLLLVGSATAICLWGGQVTLVVTDYIQSVFVNAMLIGIMVVIYRTFTWDQFAEAFQSAPNGEALLNPFRAQDASEFDKWFFFVFPLYWMIYGVISWAPNSMLVSSARDAHEAKMMRTMLYIRNLAMMGLGLLVLPLAAFVLMHHPDFTGQAAQVDQVVQSIAGEQVRSQMLTPATLVHILPVGMMGAFAGVVLFLFITSHDTYLLSWGSILIQDVIVPLRGRPLTPRQHLRWIRASVLFVAAFVILFSLMFHQVDNIFMFMAISASLYTASAGAVLLGALYWRRATSTAACVTMVVGAVLSMIGFIYRSCNPKSYDGQTIAFLIAIPCIVLYVTISYLGRGPRFDLDGMLNRKQTEAESARGGHGERRWWRFSPEVPRSDRVLIPVIAGAIVVFLVFFVAAWGYNLMHEVPVSSWVRFWHGYLHVMFTFGTVFLVWITVGGARDLFRLWSRLKTGVVDERDDGTVAER